MQFSFKHDNRDVRYVICNKLLLFKQENYDTFRMLINYNSTMIIENYVGKSP